MEKRTPPDLITYETNPDPNPGCGEMLMWPKWIHMPRGGEDVDYLLATPLRAAAPDLLEALQDLMDMVNQVERSHVWPGTMAAARAAITKATGGSDG